jgi:hypothetical protein
MSVGQMLAHCNVTYEIVYEDKHPKPGMMMGMLMNMFVKKPVVGEKGYKRNSLTAPQFLITGEREFDAELDRLVGFINKTQQLVGSHFEGKESHSFGPLRSAERNNMFYKHLDHHLTQFGGWRKGYLRKCRMYDPATITIWSTFRPDTT